MRRRQRALLAGVVGVIAGAGLIAPQLANAAAPGVPYNGTCPAPVTVQTQVSPTTVPGAGAQVGPCVRTIDPVGPLTGFYGGSVGVGVTTTNGPNRICPVALGNSSPVAPDTQIGPEEDVNLPVGVYVIADGDNQNTIVAGQSSGYAGVSNYESGNSNETCPENPADPGPYPTATGGGPENGNGSNSGGSVGIDNVVYAPVPFVVCGYTSGRNFGGNSRDGCYNP
jgi:hypothetical protein